VGTNGIKNVNDPAQNSSQAHAGHGLTSAASQSKQHRHGC
jgi:hypothetical protein